MNIETEYQTDHQMKLTIQVDPQEVEAARHQAARNLSKHKKIPGFRPGKAPLSVVIRSIGEADIFEEAIQIIANNTYPKAIEETGIKPYGPGQMTNIVSADPLTLEFLVPLDAEVTLGEYHVIRIPYAPPNITDNEVTKVLNDLRERHVKLESVDRPAESTDQVELKLSACRNHPDEGVNPELIEEHVTTLNLAQSDTESEKEWPFPGFAQKLIGSSTGAELSISYTFPEDSVWASLRGEDVTFNVHIQAVKERHLPTLDDDFAKSISEYPSIEELTTGIRTSLETQTLEEYNAGYQQQIVAEIVKISTIKYPPQMIEREIGVYIDQLQNRLAQQGLDLETYLKTRQMSNDALIEEIRPLAEQRLLQTLVIFQVAQQEQIQVNEEEIEAESSKVLAQISRYMTPEQARKAISGGYIQHLVGNISTDLIFRRTYDLLESIAKGENQLDVNDQQGDQSLPIEAPNQSDLTQSQSEADTPSDTEILQDQP